MADDALKDCLERWEEGSENVAEQHNRMKEDLEFSNPAEPKQWTDFAMSSRKGRPCLTFDRTNQFIVQVVNNARMKRPQIQCIPADSGADVAVAEKLNGMIRHIEYSSRASIAYDTGIESMARCGMGFLRVLPEIVDVETNEQEIRIKRIFDPFSCVMDCDSTEPDGSDARWAQVAASISKKAYERKYPKAAMLSVDDKGWFDSDSVRICEEFLLDTEEETVLRMMVNGTAVTATPEEYESNYAQLSIPYQEVKRKKTIQHWRKFSGAEILEETLFPANMIPVIPIIGDELWVNEKRFICGLTRRLMDGQRAFNYEHSAYIEAVALQPKAPFMAASEAIEGHEQEWRNLNTGNPAYLPYNAFSKDGQQIDKPSRLSPPVFPAAFAQGMSMASQDMQAGVGIFDANLGRQGTAVSGRAKIADQQRGDIATFHYTDNFNRSLEQMGRVIVSMIPRIYDTSRQAKIVGEDGKNDFVQIDTQMQVPSKMNGRKVVAINPSVGRYDVRVKSGPGFASLRQESAEHLTMLMQAAPGLIPILGDVMVRMQDWPEADRVSKRLRAMLPPEIKAIEPDEDQDSQLANNMQQMMQRINVMENAGAQLQDNLADCQKELQKVSGQLQSEQEKRIKAEIEAERNAALLDVSQAQQQAKDQIAQASRELQESSEPEEAKEKSAPQNQMAILDVNGQMVGALAPALESIAQSVEQTSQTIAALAQSQQQLGGMIQDSRADSAAIMAEIAKPKVSTITVKKQKDGSFVGEKVET